jgi:hypothetical protein
MGFRIDEAELVQALDRRIPPTLPTKWPGGDAWPVRSSSVSDHFDYLEVHELASLPRDVALAFLVDQATYALVAYSDASARTPASPTTATSPIDGDVLRVRFGRVPREHPDSGHLADELEPIPIRDIIIDD